MKGVINIKRVIKYIAYLIIAIALVCILYSAYYRFYGAEKARQEYTEMLSKCSVTDLNPSVIFEYPIDSTSTLVIAVDETSKRIIIGDIGAKNVIPELNLLTYTGVCSYAVIGEDGKVMDTELETYHNGKFYVWNGTITENSALDMHLEAGANTAGSIETEIIHVQYITGEENSDETIFSYIWGDGRLVVRKGELYE